MNEKVLTKDDILGKAGTFITKEDIYIYMRDFAEESEVRELQDFLQECAENQHFLAIRSWFYTKFQVPYKNKKKTSDFVDSLLAL